MARSARREAVGSFAQALGALQHLLGPRDNSEHAIDLRLALRLALRPLGDFARILTALREAETLAAALDDPRRLGQVLRFLAHHFHVMGTYDQASTAAQRALVLATAGGDIVLHALATYSLGEAYQTQGDYRRAIDCCRETVASLDGARHGTDVPAGSGSGGTGAIEVKGCLTRGGYGKGSCEQSCAAREPFLKMRHRVRPVPCSICDSEAYAMAKLSARFSTVRPPFYPRDPRAAALH
jgi:tetratricopeptide (TPR) repeat protein